MKTVLKYLILVATVVASLGPTVATLAGAVPSNVLSVLSAIVSAAGAVHLFLTESPLLQPLLSTKPPAPVK